MNGFQRRIASEQVLFQWSGADINELVYLGLHVRSEPINMPYAGYLCS